MNKGLIFLILVGMLVAFNLGYNAFPSFRHLKFYAPAIDDQGKGTLVGFEMYFMKGTGRTYVNVQNAAFKEDVENALRKARTNADRYLGVSSNNLDLYLEVSDEGRDVSGESAGGMFAVGVIALETGKKFRDDVAISATISEDGRLAEVGGIEEKIIAAKEENRKTFLVSKNQKIKDEAELDNGIQIIRVNGLADAVKYLLA